VAATPDRLRGRVNSVARLIAQLGSPVGPLVAGLLLQSISAPATVAAIVAWMALLAAWTTVSPAIRAAPSLADVVKPEAVEALAQPEWVDRSFQTEARARPALPDGRRRKASP
jgi:MFS family permease